MAEEIIEGQWMFPIDPSLARWSSPQIVVWVKLNGQDIPMVFNPGADTTFLYPRTYQALGLRPVTRTHVPVAGPSRSLERIGCVLESVQLGHLAPITKVAAVVMDFPIDESFTVVPGGWLGMNVWSHFESITLDLINCAMTVVARS